MLPFTNLSNDPEQQYFADGITEDLTTDLSRLANMFVISRNTAFTYKNKSIDTRQIGRELGVRYVLEGSVRRSGLISNYAVQLWLSIARQLWWRFIQLSLSPVQALCRLCRLPIDPSDYPQHRSDVAIQAEQ